HGPHRGRRVPVHLAQGRLPQPLPRADAVPAASWRLPRRRRRVARARSAPRPLLRGLLLGADGAALRRRRHEPDLGGRDCRLRADREGLARRPDPRPPRRACLRRLGPRAPPPGGSVGARPYPLLPGSTGEQLVGAAGGVAPGASGGPANGATGVTGTFGFPPRPARAGGGGGMVAAEHRGSIWSAVASA